MTDIEQMMRTLKLGGLAKEWKSVEYHDTEQYVTELLKIELHEREVNRINRMVKIAGFHVIKTLDDFEWEIRQDGDIHYTLKMTEFAFVNIRR